MARDLDRLGGNFRPAIKRGMSQKFLLEWLKDAVHEQGDKLEEALAKDPNSGRYEIARQEAHKLAKALGNSAQHRFTVKEWQTMRHTDLRAQQAREEAERKAREPHKPGAADQESTELTVVRWVPASGSDGRRPPAAQGSREESSGRAGAIMSTDMPAAEWRVRVARAKRKAMMIISVVLAFRGRKHRARGLQRLDSLSYFIAQHLGPELPRFVDEQASYRATKANASGLQAMAEEVWREQQQRRAHATMDGYGDPGSSQEPDIYASPPNSGPLPDFNLGRSSSPRTLSNNGYSNNASANVGYRASPPPPLRLPGTVTGGPSGGASAQPGSPLLRSRPVNLTPSLHHISQAVSAPVAPSALQIPPPPPANIVRPMSSSSLPSPSGSGAPPIASTSSGNAGSSLPALRPRSGLRMSMPNGVGVSQALPLAPEAVSLSDSRKSMRFSAPGGDADGAGDSGGSSGGGALPTSATEDGTSATTGGAGGSHDVAPPPTPTANLAVVAVSAAMADAPEGKRWSAMRFLRRKEKEDRSGLGLAGSRRGGAAALLAEELSLVERAQSWAGPGPMLRPLQTSGPNTRSLGLDGPVSPSGAAGGGSVSGADGGPPPLPAPPQLPLPPMGTRGPRTRRASGLLLLGAHPGGPLPSPSVPFGVPLGVPSTPLGFRAPSAAMEHSNSIGGGGGSSLGLQAPVPAPAPVPVPVSSLASNSTVEGHHPHKTRVGSTGSSPPGARSTIVPRKRNGGAGGAASRHAGSVTTDHSGSAASVTSGEPPPSFSFHNDREHVMAGIAARRMGTDGSGDQLLHKSQEETQALERPMRMMQMYANRANARWVEDVAGPPPTSPPSPSSAAASGGWEPPHVYDASRFATAVGGAQSSAFRTEVASMFKAGKIAVQLLAGDDQILLSNGQTQALWSADPWDLIASAFPAKANTAERIRAVHMGPRLLMALVMSIEALAGPEALSRLVVVLHMNEEQQEQVVRDLSFRKFCGLSRENLILLVQQRRSGYAWDRDHMVFMRDEGSQLASAGSGYAIMQLVWPEESYQIAPGDGVTQPPGVNGGGPAAPAGTFFDAEAGGAPVSSRLVPMGVSVVDYLSSRGVEWLLTRRLRDINLYHPEMTLDPDVLAYTLFLSDLNGANMSVQVEYVDSVQAARNSHSGIVLAPPRNRRAMLAGAVPSAGGAPSPLRRAGTSTAPVGRGNPLRTSSDVTGAMMAAAADNGGGGVGGGGAGGGGGGMSAASAAVHPHVVVDIKIIDTATPRVTQILNETRSRAKGRLAVSTRRYLWKVEVLKSLVQRPSVFRPSLEVAGDLAYLTFDMSDLTAATEYGARCVAVSGRHPARSLLSAADLEDLLGVIAAQDASSHFRRLAGNTTLPHAASMPHTLDATGRRALVPPLHSLSYGPSNNMGGGSVLSTPSHSAPGSAPPYTPTGAAGGLGSQANGEKPALGSMGGAAGGQRVVVLVANNDSTGMAVALLRGLLKPGRDSVALVTVVSTTLGEPAGRALLKRHEAVLAQAMVEVTCEVLIRNHLGSLYDQLDSYCDMAEANLIVMGSQVLAGATTSSSPLAGGGSALGGGGGPSGLPGFGFGSGGSGGSGGLGLGVASSGASVSSSAGGGLAVMQSGMSFSTGGGGGNAIMASVALSLLRVTTRPVLIVKANAKHTNVQWDRDKLRVLMEVNHTSRGLLRYVCTRLMDTRRDDKLYLARGGAKEQLQAEALTSRRLLSNFSDIAQQFNIAAVKRPMEEPFESGALKYAEHDRVNIIAIQAPAGRSVPGNILSLLKAARNAVLIYKSNDTS